MTKYFEKQIQRLVGWCNAKIGFTAIHTLTNKSLSYNAGKEFLLCSTYKIPMAVCLLKKAEENKLNLNDLISIYPYDFRLSLWHSTLNRLQYDSFIVSSLN